MDEKKLICPQCQISFPLGKHSPTGVWTCPECFHEFRPAKSDLEPTPVKVKKDRFPIFSLILMAFTVFSLLGTLTWLVPSLMGSQIDCQTKLSCLSQSVWDFAQDLQSQSCQIWPLSILGVFFLWLFVVRFFKGVFRWVFNLTLILFYLSTVAAVAGAVWMVYCQGGCPGM